MASLLRSVSIKKVIWGPVTGFRALIIIIPKRLVRDVELEKIIGLSHCVILFFVSFSFVVKVIFLSKSPKKSSKKMFPFNVQLSGNNLRFLRPKCYFMLC